MNCRHCGTLLKLPLIDLGSAPPSNAFLTPEGLFAPEQWFPLRVVVCTECWLAQTEDFASARELFGADYPYYSSYSATWLAHARRFVDDVISRFGLGTHSHVVEVAANDGYLLQYVKQRGIPCTGVEPTAGTAAAAMAKGIPIVREFFGKQLATEMAGRGLEADLLVANNVLAHVPDVNDFVAGFARLLKLNGVATFEFPHLLRLVAEHQFDTVYHEHYSYLSLTAVDQILTAQGLKVFDVEELLTHGGSLRVFACRSDSTKHSLNGRVKACLDNERRAGMRTEAYYAGFQTKAEKVKDEFVLFLLRAKREGARVVAYGAAAKGNTLINYAGVRRDLISFVVDRNPTKQGKFMPGSRIPIVAEELIVECRPDYIVLLPWNLRHELSEQLSYARQWGARLVTAVPELSIV